MCAVLVQFVAVVLSRIFYPALTMRAVISRHFESHNIVVNGAPANSSERLHLYCADGDARHSVHQGEMPAVVTAFGRYISGHVPSLEGVKYF